MSAFTDLMSDDYTPVVLLAHTNRADDPLISEQGPDLTSGVVTMDDVTFETLLSLTSGASATSRFCYRALLDTGSPQSSILRQIDNTHIVGFGFQYLLRTNRQARMTIQFYHDGTSSASLAVLIYIVPNETIRRPLLLGRDSWIRFHSRSYQTLAP